MLLSNLPGINNDIEITVEELVNTLVNVKNEILNNWDRIKSEDNVSTKYSALGTTMHYLSGFSLRPFVTLDVKINDAEPILAGLFISDVSPVEYNNGTRVVTLNSPDPHLAATLLISLISYLDVDKIKDYIYVTISEGKAGLNVSFKHIIPMTGRLRDKIEKFIVNREKAETLLSNPRVPDYLVPWLREALGNWGVVRFRKGVRFVYYAVNGFIGRASLFGWFVGDGVLGHVGRGSFDIGFSFVTDEPLGGLWMSFCVGSMVVLVISLVVPRVGVVSITWFAL